MKQTVSNKIATFNYICTLGVVVQHCRMTNIQNVVAVSSMDTTVLNLYTKFTEHLCWTDMVFFFMMSGFLLYRNLTSVQDSLVKMRKRLKTLLIPFIVWTCVTIVWYRLYYIVDVITSVSDIKKVFFFNPSAGPMWYCLALLLLMLPCPLIVFLHKKNKKISYLMLLVFAVVAIIRLRVSSSWKWPENWWWYGNMVGFVPAYMLGAYIGLAHSDKVAKELYDTKKSKLIGGALFVCAVLLWVFGSWKYGHYYAVLEIAGLWLLLDSDLFKTKQSFMASAFICFAIHSQILIPLVEKHMLSECGIITGVRQLILFKIVEVFIIALIAYDVQIILKKILPPKIYALFTGGR